MVRVDSLIVGEKYLVDLTLKSMHVSNSGRREEDEPEYRLEFEGPQGRYGNTIVALKRWDHEYEQVKDKGYGRGVGVTEGIKKRVESKTKKKKSRKNHKKTNHHRR